MKQTVLPVFAASIWISLSEFVRNEILLKRHWVDHYSAKGLIFPGEPVNGAVWGLWSLLFAITILILSKRFSFKETVCVSWLVGFVLMWVVAGNLGVLPFSILLYAIPLSILETWLAALIIFKLSNTEDSNDAQ